VQLDGLLGVACLDRDPDLYAGALLSPMSLSACLASGLARVCKWMEADVVARRRGLRLQMVADAPAGAPFRQILDPRRPRIPAVLPMVNRTPAQHAMRRTIARLASTSLVPLYLTAPIDRSMSIGAPKYLHPAICPWAGCRRRWVSYRRHRSVGPDHQRPAVRLPTIRFGSCTRSLTAETDSQRADGGRRAWPGWCPDWRCRPAGTGDGPG
jgi:hypothetical protein